MSGLKHLTLISDTGLLLFHTSFSVKEVDEVLISGFTGAIASIVHQLGDTLEVIVMQNQTFYLHPFENFIILLATETGLDDEYVNFRLNILEHSTNLITMGTEDDLERLIEASNELHLEVAELFEMDVGGNNDIFDFDDDNNDGIDFNFDDDNLFDEVLKELDGLV